MGSCVTSTWTHVRLKAPDNGCDNPSLAAGAKPYLSALAERTASVPLWLVDTQAQANEASNGCQ